MSSSPPSERGGHGRCYVIEVVTDLPYCSWRKSLHLIWFRFLCWNNLTESNWGGMDLLTTPQFIKDSKGKNSYRAKPGGRGWWRGHEELLLTDLISLLSDGAQNHQPRGGTTHNGLHPPTSSTNWGNVSPIYLQPDLLEVFSQLEFPPLRWL